MDSQYLSAEGTRQLDGRMQRGRVMVEGKVISPDALSPLFVAVLCERCCKSINRKAFGKPNEIIETDKDDADRVMQSKLKSFHA
jgi:hypothetical protein